jgi:hypothetical protein
MLVIPAMQGAEEGGLQSKVGLSKKEETLHEI